MKNDKILNKFDLMLEREKIRNHNKICNLYSYLDFMYYSGIISEDEFINKIKSIPNCSINLIDELIDDLLVNRFLLSNSYSKVTNLYSGYKKNKYDYDCDCEDVNLDILFNDFMKYYQCDKLYNTLKHKNMIAIVKRKIKNSDGLCLEYGNLSYIIIREVNNKISFYSCLAHEMGHALSFNIINKQNILKKMYAQEIFSILFEKSFLDYLIKNSEISNDVILSYIQLFDERYFKIIKKCKEGLDIFDNPKIDYIFVDETIKYNKNGKEKEWSMIKNNYAIGDIVATKLLNMKENDEDYFIRNLSNLIIEYNAKPLNILINENLDLNLIEKRLEKNFIKR